MTLRTVYADLHVHLGGIKMAAALDLTVGHILYECVRRKGIGMVGIIDAAAPPALAQLRELVGAGELRELPGGGLTFRDQATLVLGCEVEVYHNASLHLCCYFPGFGALAEFSRWQATVVKNPNLSTQRHRATAARVVEVVAGLGGFVIPAHCFTPHKSILAAAGAVAPVIPPELWRHVPAVELGLSADTALAEQVPELGHFAFVTNSDAHSLPRIAREYNELALAAPTLSELRLALAGAQGRRVVANYGLDPRLGKYHRSYCLACDQRIDGAPPQTACPVNLSHRIELGVLDRVHLLAAGTAGTGAAGRQPGPADGAGPAPPPPAPGSRPPYVHQVPLQFVPGLGKRALDKLLAAFGTEMDVLHRVAGADLAQVVGAPLAARIEAARTGRMAVAAGAGGVYGKLLVG